MSPGVHSVHHLKSRQRTRMSASDRIRGLDWAGLSRGLDASGNAIAAKLLTPAECRAVAGLYTAEDAFRSRVVMGRHGYGRGEYKYFAYPLPPLVAELRAAFYPHLVPIANRWNEQMHIDVAYPHDHATFL